MTDTNIQDSISIAKIRMADIKDTQFMFALCCMLQTHISHDLSTAGTDGKNLYINPTFWQSLDKDEQVFLLAHETLHVAYQHMIRGELYDKQKFNASADYVINAFLVDRGFKFIDGGLLDRRYDGLSTEEVYRLLPDTPKNLLDGDIIYGNLSDTDKQEITQKIISASHVAEMNGALDSIPEDVKRFLDSLRQPKVNWKVVLRRFMQSVSKTDYSWKRPNKRLLSQRLYLPSLLGFGLSKVTFAIDVSVSIDLEMFNQFIAETNYLFKQLNPSELEILQFHHKIAKIDTVNSLSDFKKITYTETGGTNLYPVINHFMNNNSKALVVITDGYFSKNLPNPKKSVLWVIFDNDKFKPPFGTVIHFQM